ncbi:MAG: transglutaminase domain-containing protein [Acidimicrobiia bacterium]|nr:transglutaminase domain-containing protein [Acidimicrobiia bacterium]
MTSNERTTTSRATAQVTAVTAALALSFARVFDGWDFLPHLLVIAIFSHTTCFIARSRRPIVTIGELVVVYVLVAWLRLRDTLWFGLPLGRTWDALVSQLSTSLDLVGDIKPPIDFDTGFGLAACLAIGVVAVLADAFAFRAAGRGETLVPSAIVFAVVSVVGGDRHRVVVTIVWVFASVLAVATLRRPNVRRARTDVGPVFMAVVIALLAGVIGPNLPGARSDALIDGKKDEGRVVEPLVDVRGRLGDRSDTVLFRVEADRPSYWHLTSLSDFDGVTWGVPETELESAGGELAQPVELASTLTTTQTISIDNLEGSTAPVAYEPIQLRSASRSLFYAMESGTLLVSEEGLRPGDRYQIVSSIVDPPVATLTLATSNFPPSADYFDLPTSTEMNRVGDIARDLTDATQSPYERAIALQTFFRDNFTYSLDVPSLTSGDAFIEFLDRRSGYCEQFASTFAVMARAVGLPSRVAIGFTPGESDADGGYVVRSQHAHAWPEIWFDGIGWLMFEPTPGRGAPGRTYTGVAPQQDDSPPTPTTPTPTTTPSGETPTTTTTTPDAVNPSSPVTVTTIPLAAESTTSGSGSSVPLVVLLVVTPLIAWPFAIRLLVRRRLRREGSHPVVIMWRRMIAVDGTIDDSSASLTTTDIADRLSLANCEPSDLPRRLATAVERLLFADRSPDSSEIDDLDTQLRRWIINRHPSRDWRHELTRRYSLSTALRLAGAESRH